MLYYPSFILKLYNFFHKNTLFTRDLNYCEAPNLFHNAFTITYLKTFHNTKFERHNCIMFPTFRSNLVQSSVNILFDMVHGSIMIHWSFSTKRYSILIFHNLKLFPLNWSISIFELVTISFHHKNWYCRYATLTRFSTSSSQNP